MEAPPADRFIHTLSANHRVVLLGGMAIIAYGLNRKTKDVDIWLDPMASPEEWASCLVRVSTRFSGAEFWSLGRRCELNADEIAFDVKDFGVIRIRGFDRDIDVFRHPNELEIESFDQVWHDASRVLEGGTRLPQELDLYQTKANTGRDHDLTDQLFLESLLKKRFRERLPLCDLAEATAMLDRYLDPEILQYAESNPHPEVRALALKYLWEFEAEGDPYSRDILAAWKDK